MISAAVSALAYHIHESRERPQAFHPFSAVVMSAPIPRFLLPRGYMIQYAQLPKFVRPPQTVYRTLPLCRNASASTSKPRILEKPTKFNPPSHGKRLKKQTPRQYGPQLTGEQVTEQQAKKYPNMMPAPGTFMHWFLTSRGIHTFITLVRRQITLYLDYFISFASRYTGLIHPTRAPSLSSPPSPPLKDGASPPHSANSSPQFPTSSLSL